MALIRRVLHNVARQPRPAEIAHQPFGHHVKAVGAPHLRAGRLIAGIDAGLRRHQQLPVLRQLLTGHVGLLRQRMIDTADRDHFHSTQYAPLKGFGDFIVIEQQAEVGATVDQFARDFALGGAGQLHFQAGKLLGQFTETFHQRLIRHRLVLSHPQLRLLTAQHRHGPAVEALALAQHFAGLFQQCRARLGEHRLPTAAAFEQAHAQILFEHRNSTADCRLRLTLSARHGGERPLFSDIDKYPQLIEIPLHACYQPIYRTDR